VLKVYCREYSSIGAFLRAHEPDGRMAKLKLRDLPIE
jgi:hypothetical protein